MIKMNLGLTKSGFHFFHQRNTISFSCIKKPFGHEWEGCSHDVCCDYYYCTSSQNASERERGKESRFSHLDSTEKAGKGRRRTNNVKLLRLIWTRVCRVGANGTEIRCHEKAEWSPGDNPAHPGQLRRWSCFSVPPGGHRSLRIFSFPPFFIRICFFFLLSATTTTLWSQTSEIPIYFTTAAFSHRRRTHMSRTPRDALKITSVSVVLKRVHSHMDGGREVSVSPSPYVFLVSK